MKLELKHLAPYFPFGLTGKTRSEFESWKIIGFKEDSFSITEPTLLCTHPTYNNVINIWSRNIKPILRPLSDLTKEIEHNGEKISPTVCYWFRENCENFNISKTDMEKLISMFLYVFEDPLSAPYYFIEKLFEWHFDVFGLIDAGLAIDINSLESKV